MIAPLLLAILLLAAWEAYARLGGVDEFLLPAPTPLPAGTPTLTPVPTPMPVALRPSNWRRVKDS